MLSASVRRTILPHHLPPPHQAFSSCRRLSLLSLITSSPLKREPRNRPLSCPTLRPISTTSPRRATYRRFGDDYNNPVENGEPDKTGAPPNSTTVRDATITLVFVGAGVYYLVHLERVPESGRWRFMDISPKYETKLWESSHQELVQEFRGKIIPPNHFITRYVHGVVSRLLEANELGSLRSLEPNTRMSTGSVLFGTQDYAFDDPWSESTPAAAPTSPRKTWNLLVVNDPKMVNAMATPGSIVVFTGILPACKNEQGLAAVLGHEIAHVVARHPAERYSSVKVLLAIGILMDLLGFQGLGSFITKYIMQLPNSRQQELEADKIGLKLMAKACYDPAASPAMFRRLGAIEEKQGGRYGTDFLDTHPSSEKRITQLESALPEAYTILAASPDCAGLEDQLGRFRDSVQFSLE